MTLHGTESDWYPNTPLFSGKIFQKHAVFDKSLFYTSTFGLKYKVSLENRSTHWFLYFFKNPSSKQENHRWKKSNIHDTHLNFLFNILYKKIHILTGNGQILDYNKNIFIILGILLTVVFFKPYPAAFSSDLDVLKGFSYLSTIPLFPFVLIDFIRLAHKMITFRRSDKWGH